MHKKCLQFSLQEVGANQNARQPLQIGAMDWSGSVKVPAKNVDKWVDQQWTQILDNEDSSPGNLRPQILHIHCALVHKPY